MVIKLQTVYRNTEIKVFTFACVCVGVCGGGGGQLNHKKGIKVALEGGNYTLLSPTFQPL